MNSTDCCFCCACKVKKVNIETFDIVHSFHHSIIEFITMFSKNLTSTICKMLLICGLLDRINQLVANIFPRKKNTPHIFLEIYWIEYVTTRHLLQAKKMSEFIWYASISSALLYSSMFAIRSFIIRQILDCNVYTIRSIDIDSLWSSMET